MLVPRGTVRFGARMNRLCAGALLPGIVCKSKAKALEASLSCGAEESSLSTYGSVAE